MKNKIAIVDYGRYDYLHGRSHQLECCLCGESDRDKLIIEDLGFTIGMNGRYYSFCKKCWDSKNLGEKLLKLIECPDGLKIKDEFIRYELGE